MQNNSCKYRDLFTEKSDILNYMNIDTLSKLEIKINHNLTNKFANPLSYGWNTFDLVLHLFDQNQKGYRHLTYMEFIKKYGDNGLSSNLLVPILHSLNDEMPSIKEMIIVSDPEDAEKLARNHVKKMPILEPLLHDSIISTTDIEHWKDQRLSFITAFNPLNSLDKILPISRARAKKCSDILWNLSKKGTVKVNINDFFLNETLAQLQLALFGFTDTFQESINKIIRDAFGGKGSGNARKYTLKVLEELKKSDGPLSNAFTERECKTDTEAYGNAMLFLFAGHDTTGNTLTWLIYELAKNNTYQKRLQNEVDKFWLEQNRKDITLSDFKRLPFMTKCITETLRLWTAVPNGTFRELVYDDEIQGLAKQKIKIPRGTYVQILNWSRHRNPDLWGEEADIFNPDREYKDNEIWNNEVFRTYNPNSKRYSPFTYEPRDCIGKNFAQIEMRLMILYLLKNFTFFLTDKQFEKSINDTTLGINKGTLTPMDVYNPINTDEPDLRHFNMGLYVNVFLRGNEYKSFL